MGLFDNLNDKLGDAMASPLFALGTGLIAGAQPFANPGQQLQSAASNQQSLAMNRMQMRMLQQQWPMMMQAFGALGGLMGPPAAGVPQASQQPVSAAPALSGAPRGASAPAPPPAASGTSASPGLNPLALERFGLMTSAFPMTKGMSDAALKVAEMRSQYDPALQTQLAASKDALTVDQQLMAEAQRSKDPLAFSAARMKYLKDAGLVTQSSMNGAVQTFGGVTPEMLGMSTYNPTQGVRTIGGVESPIPGAPATEATLAGAKAGAESAAEYAPIFDSKGTQIGFAPRAAIVNRPPAAAPPLGAPGPGTRAAGTAGGGATFGIGPQTADMLKGGADTAIERNKEYQSQAENSQQMVAQVQALQRAAQDFTPGKFADARASMLQYMDALGLNNSSERKALASYQEGSKIAIQLQAAATKQLGSREAAQVFDKMGQSLPNLTLSKDGLTQVAGWQSGISRYYMDRAAYANKAFAAGDANGVNNTEDTWIKNSDPTYYVLASLPAAQRQSALKSMGQKNATTFIQKWNQAERAGFAPAPSDYGN